MENITDIIARNVRKLRREKGWSQRQLAMKLDAKQRLISQWELSKACPSAYYLDKLATAFDCSMDELFLRKDAPAKALTPKVVCAVTRTPCTRCKPGPCESRRMGV